ncbi:MAG: hypothetical protein QNK37_20750 [Acidobacteriota bacterium]|nr:hypothetical protein [Acidobacteriota bacterium]
MGRDKGSAFIENAELGRLSVKRIQPVSNKSNTGKETELAGTLAPPPDRSNKSTVPVIQMNAAFRGIHQVEGKGRADRIPVSVQRGKDIGAVNSPWFPGKKPQTTEHGDHGFTLFKVGSHHGRYEHSQSVTDLVMLVKRYRNLSVAA